MQIVFNAECAINQKVGREKNNIKSREILTNEWAT